LRILKTGEGKCLFGKKSFSLPLSKNLEKEDRTGILIKPKKTANYDSLFLYPFFKVF